MRTDDKTKVLTAAGCLVLWLFSVSAIAASRTDIEVDEAKAASQITAGGYSIFDETMVDMTWQEVEQAAREGALVLTMTAVIEEHGPHMSCGIDAYLGYLMCKLVRRELESMGVKAVIAPPFYWGINRGSHVFAGTFTVREETMKAVLFDMFSSLKNMGFTRVFNINAHGDGLHIQTAVKAVIEAREKLGIDIRYLLSEDEARRSGLTDRVPPFLLIHKTAISVFESQEYMDLHAGAWETSAVAAFFPEAVDAKAALRLEPTKVKADQLGEWVRDMKNVTPLGYLGDPARYDVEKVRKEIVNGCRMMAEAIAEAMKND